LFFRSSSWGLYHRKPGHDGDSEIKGGVYSSQLPMLKQQVAAVFDLINGAEQEFLTQSYFFLACPG
jgi:hypothetical protein